MAGMPADTRLLVAGDDGSPATDAVWGWLVSQTWPGWSIEILTADEEGIKWGQPPESVEWSPPWERNGTVPGALGVRYLKVNSDPRPMLGDRTDADLLVVGRPSVTHEHLPAIGSTSDWLLHHPVVPLALIGQPGQVSSVVVCVDGSTHSQRATDMFSSLPLAAATQVTLISVDDDRVDTEGAIERANTVLQGHVASVAGVVLHGSPTEAILRHLDEASPDLVVMGTKGLTGWQRLLLGSTAGAVARTSRCNLLICSAEGS
jgi:nucleotide-binding universal stress UspA family protein